MTVQNRYPQPLADQRRFFDELITEEWHTYQSESWDFSRRFEVAQVFRRIRPARILDIGCGCGFHDVEMAGYDFVERVDAIDYSAQSILKANEVYPHAKVVRRVADLAADMPEPVYDLTVSFQVFEHLSDPAAYFRYAISACRPGGALAIVTPNAARLDNRLRRMKGLSPTFIDPQHFHEYTTGELKRLGAVQGLAAIDTFAHGLHSLVWPWMTPRDYRQAERWGAALPSVASVIGVVFRVPER